MSGLDPYRALFDLTGRRAVVIGAGSGIGQAGARGLAAHGASVVCADVSALAAEDIAAEIRNAGGQAESAVIDVADVRSVAEFFDGLGAHEILVTTPAINVRKRLLDLTEDEFRRVVSINLEGTFNVITRAGRIMAEAGKGSIIVISSIRAQVVEPGQGVYAATKAGVVQMIRALAAELGPSAGERARSRCGGNAPHRADQDRSGTRRTPARAHSVAQPIELAGPIVYLASDASSFVTGSFLAVDGGWLAIDGRYAPPL